MRLWRKVVVAALVVAAGSSPPPAIGGAGPAFLLRDINTTEDDDASSYPDDFVSFEGEVFFTRRTLTAGYTRDLWKTDGTADGTRLAVPALEGFNSGPLALTEFGGRLFYLTSSSEPPSVSLWQTDDTVAGTALVKQLFGTGPDASSGSWLEPVAGGLLFLAGDDHGLELWKTDGTSEGTSLLRDIQPGPESSIYPNDPIVPIRAERFVYFPARDNPQRRKTLWRTDGTAEGTMRAAGVWPTGPGAAIGDGGEILFAGYTPDPEVLPASRRSSVARATPRMPARASRGWATSDG